MAPNEGLLSSFKWRIQTLAALILLSVSTLVFGADRVLNSARTDAIAELRATSHVFASIARVASPSVVFVQVQRNRQSNAKNGQPNPFNDNWPFSDDFFRRFFEQDPRNRIPDDWPQNQRSVISQGSGFVVALNRGSSSNSTYVLTNNHVVEDASMIRIILQDGRDFSATIKGRDPQSDVAVLEVATTDIPKLTFGKSSELEVGEWVVAVGNPYSGA